MNNSINFHSDNEKKVITLSEKDVSGRLRNFSPDVAFVIFEKDTSFDGLVEKLNQLYETYYSDLTYMNIRHNVSVDDCYKLIIYEQGVLKHILLFKCGRNVKHITFLNHYFRMSIEDIETVRDMIFSEFPKIRTIRFPYLYQPEKRSLMILHEQHTESEIELPESLDEYMKLLGSHTRKNIRAYKRNILKDHPTFKVTFHSGEKIDREDIAKLIGFNRSRMKTKGRVSFNSDAECDTLYRYARIRGLLCLCSINDNIIGGSLNWMFGTHVFGHVIAHDDAYSNYSAGFIVLANSIQYMIENNMKFYHLGTGGAEYKRRILGKEYVMKDVIVFRKRTDFYLQSIFHAIHTLKKNAKERLGKNLILKKIFLILRKRLLPL